MFPIFSFTSGWLEVTIYPLVLSDSTLFRAVFWVILPCKMIVDLVDNNFTRQYNPEDSSEHHTRRRENLKSQIVHSFLVQTLLAS
jgi:hypothetical protein